MLPLNQLKRSSKLEFILETGELSTTSHIFPSHSQQREFFHFSPFFYQSQLRQQKPSIHKRELYQLCLVHDSFRHNGGKPAAFPYNMISSVIVAECVTEGIMPDFFSYLLVLLISCKLLFPKRVIVKLMFETWKWNVEV